MRLPNPILDVERELTVAVKRIGGCRVDDLTGPTPGHRIADFLFDSYAVVSELKCLEKDQIGDPVFVQKVSDIYLKRAKQDKSMPVIFGTVQMTTDRLPQEFRLEIARLYAVPVRRVIASADEQIAVTKDKLPRPNHHGVLLLVNEGNTALDPAHIVWTLGECIRDGEFPNINHVIYFTVNMPVEMPAHHLPGHVRDSETDLHIWYSGGRRGVARIDPGFEPALREAWFAHLKTITGRAEQFDGTAKLLDEAKNKPNKA